MALAAYRHVLRSIQVAFQGDAAMLNGARLKARQSFEESRNLQADSDAFKQGIQHAEDVATILRQNVVQGRKAGEDNQFKLRIHEETERGDNETVKVAGQTLREKSPS